MAENVLLNDEAAIVGVEELELELPPPPPLELDLLLELPQAATASPAISETTTAKALPLSKCIYYLLLRLRRATACA
jgi:hypothetical protein